LIPFEAFCRNYPLSQILTELLQYIPRESLHPKALAFLDEHLDETWFLACSGGADSVCLLYCIYLLFPQKRKDLHILHFNHDLRGEDSQGDATFVQDLATQLNLPFHVDTGYGLRGKSEAELRSPRLNFFHRTMETYSARILLQGHQLGDIAETVLMRLSRGSSTSGLAAPRPVQSLTHLKKFHIRPLLSINRQMIHSALKASGIVWREDSSTLEDTFYRNRIRNQLLPMWSKLSPQNLETAISHTRDLLEEEDEALNSWAENAYLKLKTKTPTKLQWPHHIPTAIIRRIFYLWLHDAGLPASCLNPDIFQLALDFIHDRTQQQISITSDYTLKIDPDTEFLSLEMQTTHTVISSWPSTHLLPETLLYLPNGNLLIWRYQPLNKDIFEDLQTGKIDPCHSVWLDPANFSQQPKYFHIRQRHQGDRYQPLGMKAPVKLQNILVNRKIPASNRDQLPILTAPVDDQILWCPGCPVSDLFKITAPITEAIQIQYIQSNNFLGGF
jgi:tRNA(Ile)-lysidine synthase